MEHVHRVAGKLSDDDLEAVEDALKEGGKWIRSEGSHAEPDEIEEQKKSLESVINPIFAKLYGGGRGRKDEDEDLSMDDSNEL